MNPEKFLALFLALVCSVGSSYLIQDLSIVVGVLACMAMMLWAIFSEA